MAVFIAGTRMTQSSYITGIILISITAKHNLMRSHWWIYLSILLVLLSDWLKDVKPRPLVPVDL